MKVGGPIPQKDACRRVPAVYRIGRTFILPFEAPFEKFLRRFVLLSSWMFALALRMYKLGLSSRKSLYPEEETCRGIQRICEAALHEAPEQWPPLR